MRQEESIHFQGINKGQNESQAQNVIEDEDWIEFQSKFPQYFYPPENAPKYDDLKNVLNDYGPEMAAIKTEGIQNRKRILSLEQKIDLMMKSRDKTIDNSSILSFEHLSKSSKIVICISIFLMILSILFPPFTIKNHNLFELIASADFETGEKPPFEKHDFIFYHMRDYPALKYFYKINYNQLVLEWVLISIITVIPVYLLRKKDGQRA